MEIRLPSSVFVFLFFFFSFAIFCSFGVGICAQMSVMLRTTFIKVCQELLKNFMHFTFQKFMVEEVGTPLNCIWFTYVTVVDSSILDY